MSDSDEQAQAGDTTARSPLTAPQSDLTTPTASATQLRTIWRGGLVVLLLVALVSFVKFVLEDGGSVIFTLLMAWFAAIAMEPAVGRLSNRMRRGAATGLVMAGVGLFCLLFVILFGRLLVDQLIEAVQSLPAFLSSVLDWVNEHFGTHYTQQEALDAVGITQATLTEWAKDLASGLLGFIVSALGAFFGLFTFLLFTFYFSADAIRLRRWTARLFAPKYQNIVLTVWDLATQKTGGYVAARVVLATINGATTALFLLVIGMPYWLALGIWTGLVSQFVPTVGTYIAIILPTIVGLTGPSPIQGVLALAWGIAYQQVENLTLEPQISAKAVDVHPGGVLCLGHARCVPLRGRRSLPGHPCRGDAARAARHLRAQVRAAPRARPSTRDESCAGARRRLDDPAQPALVQEHRQSKQAGSGARPRGADDRAPAVTVAARAARSRPGPVDPSSRSGSRPRPSTPAVLSVRGWRRRHRVDHLLQRCGGAGQLGADDCRVSGLGDRVEAAAGGSQPVT